MGQHHQLGGPSYPTQFDATGKHLSLTKLDFCIFYPVIWPLRLEISFGGIVGLEKGRWDGSLSSGSCFLGTFSADPPCQLDVLGHDGDTLGVDGAQVGVLKQANQVSLAGLLKSHHSRALEPQVSLEVLSNLTNEPLEGQLTDEQLRRLLVPNAQGSTHC